MLVFLNFSLKRVDFYMDALGGSKGGRIFGDGRNKGTGPILWGVGKKMIAEAFLGQKGGETERSLIAGAKRRENGGW